MWRSGSACDAPAQPCRYCSGIAKAGQRAPSKSAGSLKIGLDLHSLSWSPFSLACSAIGALSSTYFAQVIPKARIGHPPPPPPSNLGNSFSIWVVDAPKGFEDRLKITCAGDNHANFDHSQIEQKPKVIQIAIIERGLCCSTRFPGRRVLKQSTLCVGESHPSASTRILVANFFSGERLARYQSHSAIHALHSSPRCLRG